MADGDADQDRQLCPLCLRPALPGPSTDRHHLVPRSEGGRQTVLMHRICHRQLHALFDERTLARELAEPAQLRTRPELQPFLRFIARKPPEFGAPTRRRRR